jgi:hypothetical protein
LRSKIFQAGEAWTKAAEAEARNRETLSELMKQGRELDIPVREMQRLVGIKHYNTAASLAGASQGRRVAAQQQRKRGRAGND